MKKFAKKLVLFVWNWAKIIALTLIIVIPIRFYVFQPFIVKGQSMEPSFSNGDYLIIDELTYRFRPPSRFDVLVFRFPLTPSQFYIKRLIGLPGETVEIKNGKLTIYDVNLKKIDLEEENSLIANAQLPNNENMSLTLNDDEFFVLGDNLFQSYDSRRWGALPRKNIIGRVVLRIWPINKVEAYFK